MPPPAVESPAVESPGAESSIKAPESRHQVYVLPSEADRFLLLRNLLAQAEAAKVVLFAGGIAAVQQVHQALALKDVSCGLLCGSVSEEDRKTVLAAFKQGELRLIAATDGFDGEEILEGADWVVNYDFPADPIAYQRRSAGMKRVISFADDDALFAVPEVEKGLGESLPCLMLKADDPLFLDPDRPMVEAAPEPDPEPPLPPMPKSGIPAWTANGREGRIALPENPEPRVFPTFEKALEPVAKPGEEDAYLRPLAQTARFEEWNPEN